jgi:hypothetical protein
MKHLSQGDLILNYYGESGAEIVQHIAECTECHKKFEQLSLTLSAIALPEPPSRGANYSAEVWSKIRPKLNERKTTTVWLVTPRRWAAVAAVAVLIAVAFVAERYTNRPPAQSPVEATNNAQLPQKVLVVALDDYLDRSEMLLVEVAHAKAPEDLDLNTQRHYASELIVTNRLYRQTAQRVGDADTDALLDELERVLLQVEHTPQDATASDIQQLRQEIESGGVLFKVRVAQVHMKARAKSGNRAGTVQNTNALRDQTPII